MKPETILKLQENSPEFRELRLFLAAEAEKLNSLEGLDTVPPTDRAVVVEGKLWAYKTVLAMLGELVPVDKLASVNPSEYVV